MTIMERAKQFMPFAALHGYNDVIREKQFIPSKRVELTEEDAAILSKKVSEIKKGDLVKAEYYFTDRYLEIEGAVTEIDLTFRYIRVIKTKIIFDDLKDIQVIK